MPIFTDPPDAAEIKVMADEDDLTTRGCVLLRCHRTYMRWFARLDHPKNGRRSVAELRVLSFIAREGRDGRKPGQVGDALGLTTDHVSHLLRRLERKELVTWTGDAGDARRRWYSVTDLGRADAVDFDEEAEVAAAHLLRQHSAVVQFHLVKAMRVVEELLKYG